MCTFQPGWRLYYTGLDASLDGLVGQGEPAGHQEHPSKRSDRAQPPAGCGAENEAVDRAREQDYTGREQLPGKVEAGVSVDEQQRDRMDKLQSL